MDSTDNIEDLFFDRKELQLSCDLLKEKIEKMSLYKFKAGPYSDIRGMDFIYNVKKAEKILIGAVKKGTYKPFLTKKIEVQLDKKPSNHQV